MFNVKLIRIFTYSLIVMGFVFHANELRAGQIEAIKGKRYTITKKHGPWMIMVATIREVPPNMKTEGLTPEQAADELVYELRTRGIPAYVIKRDETQANINTTNRQGKEEKRKYRLSEEYCVLAGNYDSYDDTVINKTLDYIKKLQPDFMMKNAVYRPRENQASPLSHAFKTTNPLLSQEEASQLKRDPEIEYLNADMRELSLLKQQGKYTVVVATFSGKAIFTKNDKHKESLIEQFNSKDVQKKSESQIDTMYTDAWNLAKLIRTHDSKPSEAFVYHDRFKSVVTVGAFDSPNDPKIAQIKQAFGAKYKTDKGKSHYVGERFDLPHKDNPDNFIVFDPQPSVVQVTGTKLKQVDF